MRTAPVFALLLAASSMPARAQVDCETARCAAQATIDARCPCAEAATHRTYVRCVAQVVKDLAADATIPVQCKGRIRRCAARSTCGRLPGTVVCEIPLVSGTCHFGVGFCGDPQGEIDYTRGCSSDADCVYESRCRVSASAERCAARGGLVATRPSCCPECAPSPGTPCASGLTCSAGEMCVVFGPVGPGGFTRTCHPVPAGCELDRTCGCVSSTLCPTPNVCFDVEAPGDVILCECTACV
jgi:hypothetical protein